MKKIAYISGTRADFGLETPLLKAIESSSRLSLNLYATGIHLMKQFGKTINLVRKEFPAAKIIDAKFDHRKEGMVEFAANFIKRVTYELSLNKPDLVLVHGDRIEMLCTAMVSLYLGIPIAHVQGGDKTSTVDDSARHAITKLAHLHFPATEESANSIRLMGEEGWRIHVVGTLGVDALLAVKTISRNDLFKKLDIKTDSKIILLLQHPVSEEIDKAGWQIQQTLNAVKKINLPVILIYPNSDTGSDQMIKVINQEKNNPLFRIYPNLDHSTFVSLEKEADVWVGNSSAGIVESASFKTPVVNIGIRQKGRTGGKNIINVDHNEKQIYQAIYKSLYDKTYLKSLRSVANIWGDGKAAKRIIKVLEKIKVDKKLLLKK